jgi:hypothetical protein
MKTPKKRLALARRRWHITPVTKIKQAARSDERAEMERNES